MERVMNDRNLELAGLHCHIGTFIMDLGAYAIAATRLCELASRSKIRLWEGHTIYRPWRRIPVGE
ncbi:MAG: hypothetical protein U0X39_12930 [Bacteroidales bacterium]